jgi:hypothetical protein
MVKTAYDRINIYTCTHCGHKMITAHEEKGVAPFIMACVKCLGNAQSCFYQCNQMLMPEYLWYKPKTDEEFKAQYENEIHMYDDGSYGKMLNREEMIAANKEHVSKGGLLIKAVNV